MTAKNLDEKNAAKQVMFKESKTWFEIGVDLDGNMRYGAWQIKEIIEEITAGRTKAESRKSSNALDHHGHVIPFMRRK